MNPTITLTKLSKEVYGMGDPKTAQPLIDKIPLKRLGGKYKQTMLYILMGNLLYSNSVDPDQTPRLSDLCQHCLSLSILWHTRHK